MAIVSHKSQQSLSSAVTTESSSKWAIWVPKRKRLNDSYRCSQDKMAQAFDENKTGKMEEHSDAFPAAIISKTFS